MSEVPLQSLKQVRCAFWCMLVVLQSQTSDGWVRVSSTARCARESSERLNGWMRVSNGWVRVSNESLTTERVGESP